MNTQNSFYLGDHTFSVGGQYRYETLKDQGNQLASGRRLALTLWAQGLGVLLMISLPGIGSLIVGALLTGGGFLSVVQLALECCRRQAPDHLRYMTGLLTFGYALGQLAGPVLPRYPPG